MAIKGLMQGLWNLLWFGRALYYFSIDQGNWNSHSSNHWRLKLFHTSGGFWVFLMLKSSVNLPRLLWLYVLLLYTPLYFHPESKYLPLDILKCLVTTLRNQDKKVALIQVYEDGALARSSEFTNKFHNISTIVQTKCED